MAKRFIETGLFRKRFVRSLQAPYKALYVYYITECDHSGVWDYSNLDIDSIFLDHEYTFEGIKEAFGDRIQIVDGKMFMPEFVTYQYGEALNPKNKVHASVLKRLSSLGISWPSLGASKGLGRPYQGSKDKDKDKDKERATESPIDELKTKINSLRTEWQKPARWSYVEEQHLFGGVASQMAELDEADWSTLKRFFKAYVDNAKAYWRPNSRSKFTETFPDVWASCQRWAGKNKRTVAQPRPPEEYEPAPPNVDEYAEDLAAYKQENGITGPDQAIADDPAQWADFMKYFFQNIKTA